MKSLKKVHAFYQFKRHIFDDMKKLTTINNDCFLLFQANFKVTCKISPMLVAINVRDGEISKDCI